MNIKIFFIWCISLLFTFILNTNLTQAAWLIETVDVSPNSSFMTDRSIAIANTGIVHIAYGGDHLYHAYRDGNWHVEIVDSSDQVGQHASLSLDSLGNVHISYYDAVNGALKYATNVSGSWQLETVDNGGNVEGYISVSLDSADKVHISYIGRGLKYATNSSGTWVIESVDDYGVFIGWSTSLAIDSLDKVHIVYQSTTLGGLTYVTNATGAWVTEAVDDTVFVAAYFSLALDSADKVHISYADLDYYNIPCELRYATNASGSWTMETVSSEGNVVGKYSSIALDSSDKVHISYTGGLRYSTNATGIWVREVVDIRGAYTSLALDSEDKVHISYYDSPSDDLIYARQCPEIDSDCDGVINSEDNCPIHNNPFQIDCDEDGVGDACDEETIDNDGDGVDDGEGEGHGCDNCPDTPNTDQIDKYPPSKNGCGDACECEGNFNPNEDDDVDGSDAAIFKADFGRGGYNEPCGSGNPCNGDFNCDTDVDGTDAALFKADFGRSSFNNPCPACVVGDWCSY